VTQELVTAVVTAAIGGSGLTGAVAAVVGWLRNRRRAPLDVAQLAQDVAARAVQHAQGQLDAAYAEVGQLRSELAEARAEVGRLRTELARVTAQLAATGARLSGP